MPSADYFPTARRIDTPIDGLFGRYTEVEIGVKPDPTGFGPTQPAASGVQGTRYHTGRYEWENGVLKWKDGIRIDFEVSGDADESPDTATVKLYNIDKYKESEYGDADNYKSGSPILIRSGYFSFFDQIFFGQISFQTSYVEGLDFVYEYEATDLTQNILDTTFFPNGTGGTEGFYLKYAPGWTVQQMVLDLCNTFNIPVGYIDTNWYQRWDSEYGEWGSLKQHLDNLAGKLFKYYFRNGLFYWMFKGSAIPNGLSFDWWKSGILYLRKAQNTTKEVPDAETEEDVSKSVTHTVKMLLIPGMNSDSMFGIRYVTPWFPYDEINFYKVLSYRYSSDDSQHVVECDLKRMDGKGGGTWQLPLANGQILNLTQ